MDACKYMVVDTSKRGKERFITSKVDTCCLSGDWWNVTFIFSGKTYTYRKERIVYLTNPVQIETKEHGVYIRNKKLKNIRELYQFNDGEKRYYHAIFDKYACDYDDNEIYVSACPISECAGGIWSYLRQCAKEKDNELTGGEHHTLERQYNMVDVMRDNIPLAVYIGKRKKLNKYRMPEQIIYPFSCNQSQKTAVENALTNQVSIIQGPPGTGKTQTILNIIANLLMAGKSVLIVSNNNSAVENVEEKLSDEEVGLGFLAAKLGRKENRDYFLSNQPPLPDDLTKWILPDINSVEREMKEIFLNVSDKFGKQRRLAVLTRELENLRREATYDNYAKEGQSIDDVKWLENCKTSRMLMALKCSQEKQSKRRDNVGWLFCFIWMFRFGIKTWKFLHKPIAKVLCDIDAAYYVVRMREAEKEIKECGDALNPDEMNENIKTLRSLSLQILRHKVASDGENKERREYSNYDINCNADEFLRDYPIVLSTTYMARDCIGENMIFDYVLMDEASQIDITTGVLALACAANAVIIGDSKQLPNVTGNGVRQALEAIEEAYGVTDCYRSSKRSFLQSCCDVFADAPQTLLCEHYRCHPKIIEFCNLMFYEGKLIAMTQDKGEADVMEVLFTGRMTHDHRNHAEINEIKEHVLSSLTGKGSTGIITPYRNQADEINSQLNTDIASTVHKYQGRECDNIVMSMVDNKITEFSDDPNLLNVAVSRAKSRLVIITNKDMANYNSNIGKLIEYIRYNNFNINESPFYYVFDILYASCSEYMEHNGSKKNKTDVAECLVFDVLKKYLIARSEFFDIKIIKHYPLARLVGKGCVLDDKEKQFINSKLTHVDFLLYSYLTKRPLLCVEVDGWNYHSTAVQQTRDMMKGTILAKCHIPLIRWSTAAALTKEDMFQELERELTRVV